MAVVKAGSPILPQQQPARVQDDAVDVLLDAEGLFEDGSGVAPFQRGVSPYIPSGWEELTDTPSGFLLRKGDKLYAAKEINAESIVLAAFDQERKS